MDDQRFPKDLLCSIHSVNRRLAEFVVELKNVPGAIAKASEVLGAKKANILSGFHSFYPEKEVGTWSFFVDLTEVDTTPQELAEQIRKLPVVSNVVFSEAQFGDLIIDDLHFPMVVLGKRSLILQVETFDDMFKRLYEAFGSGASVILYEMGVSAGENKARNVIKDYGVSGVEAASIILAERVAHGWGIPKLLEFDEQKPKAKVKVKDLFECVSLKGRSEEARSHFFRGYLTGVFSVIFNKKVTTTEVECIAKGDPSCSFLIE